MQLDGLRVITASAYAGMMAPLTDLPGTIAVLAGDAAHTRHGVSLEQLDGVRRRWRLADVERLGGLVPGVLAGLEHGPRLGNGRRLGNGWRLGNGRPGDGRPVVVVPPRATPAWVEAARTWPPGVRLLGSVSPLADDKIFVREQLRRLGVPVPESLAGRPSFTEAAARLGRPFVLQAPRGAGGRGTFLIEDAAGLARALAGQPPGQRWLASRWMGTTTINIAGLVHTEGFELAPASVQASGIAELGSGFGAYCGSDFAATAHLPLPVLARARAFAARVAQWLAELGHRGIFGCDIAVAGDECAFLEVNPRIQGSSWLLSRLQRRVGEPECLIEHVRAQLGQPVRRSSGVGLGGGAHVIARWTGSPVRVASAPAASSLGPLTVTGLPTPGTWLEPGAILARVESPHPLVEPSGHALCPPVVRLIEQLRANLAPGAQTSG